MKKISCCYFLNDAKLEAKLLECIKPFDTIELVEVFKNDAEMIERLSELKPSLMFINCDLEKFNTIELMKIIPRPPFTIAITKKKETVANLIDAGYFDYLEPSLDIKIFWKKFSRILELIRYISQNEQVRESNNPYRKSKSSKNAKLYTMLKHHKTHTRICVNDILYVKNAGNCLRIENCNGVILYHNSTMKQFYELLPHDQFVRINKSIIVNYAKIEKFEHNTIFIKNLSFPVSRAYTNNIKNMIRQLG